MALGVTENSLTVDNAFPTRSSITNIVSPSCGDQWRSDHFAGCAPLSLGTYKRDQTESRTDQLYPFPCQEQ
jgi:hypothetical protein